MARLDRMHPAMRASLLAMPCPTYETRPWVTGPALAQRRVALISTAGLHCRGERPFGVTEGNRRAVAGDYRLIPGDVDANTLLMSHVSTNFDRTGFQQDVNVVFPLTRLQELARAGVVGSVAAYHYSFMGATDPQQMAPAAQALARLLQQDQVTAALLVPV